MKYDADGHLIEMRRSEGSGELTKITYKDGDAVKTSTSYMGGGDMNGDGVLDGNDEREDGAIMTLIRRARLQLPLITRVA